MPVQATALSPVPSRPGYRKPSRGRARPASPAKAVKGLGVGDDMEWGAGGGVVGAVGDGGLGVGGGGIGMGVVSKEGQELGDPVDGGVQGRVVVWGGWLYGGLEGGVVGGSLLEGGSDEVGKVGGRIGVEVCRLLSG